MAFISATGFTKGWDGILGANDIVPGDGPSYQTCKDIYLFHPLGGKIAETPVRLAQSQDRSITVGGAIGEDDLIERFNEKWRALGATKIIGTLKTQSRIYGLASLGVGTVGQDSSVRLDKRTIAKKKLFFNILDPLNTSGLVTDQNPNSPTFQKHGDLRVSGQDWHRSRTVTLLNESPVFIAWTTSAFSYAGRSTYQRALYPLKSFLWSMRTDDMVVRKVGVIVTKMRSPGSFITQQMKTLFGVKRNVVKEAEVDNVISIGHDEAVESLNLQNLDGPHALARNNIIKNVATGADMPAKMLTQEAYVEGFGEGTEDAKAVAQWVDGLRIEMGPAYDFMDDIVQHTAWDQEWYEEVFQRNHPDYAEKSYEVAFREWQRDYRATWPSLIKEEPSQEVGVDDVKLKGLVAIWQVFSPELDPENKAALARDIFEGLNAREKLFEGLHFEFNAESFLDYLESQPTPSEQDLAEKEGTAEAPRPFSARDSAGRTAAVVALSQWLTHDPGLLRKRREKVSA